MSTVLVTGGTGLLGRRVVRDLAAAGHTVRVLSRRAVTPPVAGAEVAVGDLRTGWGLHQAVAATTAIVHCATDPRDGGAVDVAGTDRLLAAARHTDRPHLVYISIAGIDRMPTEYYRAKLAAEQAIAGSGLPWTVLRTTQFHEFVLDLVRRVTRLPVVPLPRGWRIQPVEVNEVAHRLAAAVASGPGHRLPDLGGPQVLPMPDIVRQYLDAAGRHRPVIELPVPGAFFAALRQGANLAPHLRAGGRTWAQFLAGQTQPDLVKG
jgi:uncharacterized protein YbjT (DUF2867 family)